MPAKLKWTKPALDAYKAAGEQMKAAGFRALRDLADPDCQSILIFWSGPEGVTIQQTFVETADVVYYGQIEPPTEPPTEPPAAAPTEEADHA